MSFDALSVKAQFPIFHRYPDLVYLDSAATSQKPASVIKVLSDFYSFENANIHRGVYDLSAKATDKYEEVREKLAAAFNANANDFAYCSGTTEGINLVVNGYLLPHLEKGDEVLITAMEHHANLIPWQQACEKKGAKLSIIPVKPSGEIDMEAFENKLSKKTKMLAMVHISNTLGTINPVKILTQKAHDLGVPVLLDAAQSAGHLPLDLQDLQVDFAVFSAHKLFGPTGIGALYCSENFKDQLKASKFGGGSIKEVSFEKTSWMAFPHGLEAGTPHIAGVVGMGAALDFIATLDLEESFAHEHALVTQLRQELDALGGIKIFGNPSEYAGIVSFEVDGVHPHDVASFLSEADIAVRAGHHCTQPLLERMQVPATTRASFSIYNTEKDVERLVATLKDLKEFWE